MTTVITSSLLILMRAPFVLKELGDFLHVRTFYLDVFKF